jgi:hypothetical protein
LLAAFAGLFGAVACLGVVAAGLGCLDVPSVAVSLIFYVGIG